MFTLETKHQIMVTRDPQEPNLYWISGASSTPGFPPTVKPMKPGLGKLMEPRYVKSFEAPLDALDAAHLVEFLLSGIPEYSGVSENPTDGENQEDPYIHGDLRIFKDGRINDLKFEVPDLILLFGGLAGLKDLLNFYFNSLGNPVR